MSILDFNDKIFRFLGKVLPFSVSLKINRTNRIAQSVCVLKLHSLNGQPILNFQPNRKLLKNLTFWVHFISIKSHLSQKQGVGTKHNTMQSNNPKNVEVDD